MRNLYIILSILLLTEINCFSTQSQTENLQVRSSAFFSSENHSQLALNIANSLDVLVYIDEQASYTLIDSDPDAARIVDLAWNSTGELLAAVVTSRTGANDHWLVWNIGTQEIILSGYIGYAVGVEWHPGDLNRLTVATGIYIYDIRVDTGAITEIPRMFSGIAEISWNSTASHLAVLEGIGRVYMLSETDYSLDFRIDENVPLSERQDFYFSFSWSPDGIHFALYDMLDTEIEIWDMASSSFVNSFPSFDVRPQHVEAILWTNLGITAYVDTNDIGLYNPQTGQVLSLINQERSAIFWDASQENLIYLPVLAQIAEVNLETLPLEFSNDTSSAHSEN
jgi:WD40 repeat protein